MLSTRSHGQQTSPRQLAPRLEQCLRENILGFWLPRCLDRQHGGYTIRFDATGKSKGPGPKMIVSQARTVWLFARLYRAGYGGKELLEAADHGYRFLRERMWEPQHGGFSWEVDVTGQQRTVPVKHLYGQSFALYALSEFARASQREDVRAFAEEFFRLLEAKSHDNRFGGYIETFAPDWTELPAGQNGPMGSAGLKLMNTHLHLLEAMTAFYQATRLPIARERLLELINIEANTVVRKNLGACTDKYSRDWTPQLQGNYAQVSYGHDIENVWLLMDACDAAGLAHGPYLDLYRTLWDYSLQYGYDKEHGGFYYTGAFSQPADNREKSWWVQAEALVSALRMWKLTGEEKYRDIFLQTWAFCDRYQIDWQHGEWHATIGPDRKAKPGDKAQAWKAGYHNGRAMIECLSLLRND